MQIHSSLDAYTGSNAIVTMGTFDGVHPGHRALLERVKHLANTKGSESVAVTFWPHPRIVLNQDIDKLRLLTTLEEKINIISEIGIDHLVVLPFDESIFTLSAEEFIRQILVEKIRMKHLVIGYNHRFGKGGSTLEDNIRFAGKYGFELSQFRHIDIDGHYPSSTKIRNLLMEGNIPQANLLLGYSYAISGQVIGGMKLGRKLAYPTANLIVNEKAKLVPPDGVYACRVKVLGKTFGGMVNIGIRPTVNNQMDSRSIEVHILDFHDDIYSEEISLQFLAKTREEMKFPGLDELREQLKRDEAQIRSILNDYTLTQ